MRRTESVGQFTKQPDGYAVTFTRFLPYPVETVWAAITDPGKLKIWFTDFKMDFQPGGEMVIWFRDEAKTETRGRIIRIEPPSLFEWIWEDELATWELQPEGDQSCILTLSYSKMQKSSYLLSVPAGFHELLNQLETVLEGHHTPYPFDGKTTPHQRHLQSMYESIILQTHADLRPQRDHPPVIVEKDIHASIERVWQAITVPEQMKNWYFDLPGFSAEVGYRFEFMGGTEEHQYRHLCTITELIPLKRLQYSWQYEGYEGDSLVTFDIFPTGGLTRIRVTHAGLETLSPIPDFAQHNFEAGWTDIIGRSLPAFLAGQ